MPDWWIPDLHRRPGPLYREIAGAIADAVRDGELQAGDRLPPHRLLARRLGIDLTTVTRGYSEAQRQGLLEARVGRGTFVRAEAPLLPRGRGGLIVDMTMNLPPVPDEPSLRAVLRGGLERLLRRHDVAALMTYRWDTGTAEDRAAAASWLRPCLGRVDAQRVLVCPGAQSAMLAVVTSCVRPGEVVLAETMTYPGLRAMAAQLGVTLAGVPTDAEGFLPEELDRACHDLQPRLIYCNPTIQNPTTATMSPARRAAVAGIARARGVPILEDDAYGLLPDDRLAALATYAPEMVFHVATTAKALTPGLRVAYLVAPGQAQAERLTAALRGTVQMGSGLLTGLLTSLIRSGEAATLLEAVRREATARQRLAAAVLDGTDHAAHPNGLHVWLRLPRLWRSAEFAAYARHQGLALVADDMFRVEGEPANAVRIALGAAAGQAQLDGALRALRAAAEREVPAAYARVV